MGGGDLDLAPVGVILEEGEGVLLLRSEELIFEADDIIELEGRPEEVGVARALTLGEPVNERQWVTGDLSARSWSSWILCAADGEFDAEVVVTVVLLPGIPADDAKAA